MFDKRRFTRMLLAELLEDIRCLYRDQLSAAAQEHGYHVEPVLRQRDGVVARSGTLDTPRRCDFLHGDTGAVYSIEAKQRAKFAPIHMILDGKVLEIAAFTWDGLTLDIAGLAESACGTLVRNWYLRWFDENETNRCNADGLYGVVHFISDAELLDRVVRFRIDLGSVASVAVIRLIEELLDQGATGLKLGA